MQNENISVTNAHANVVNKAPIDGLETSIGAIDNFNVFRKDEIKVFEEDDNKQPLRLTKGL